MTRAAEKLRLLIPRLASSADGEVLATVAAIRRVLEADGRDLHDLAATLDRTSREPQSNEPADLALACLSSGAIWRRYEAEFLGVMAGTRPRWADLSERQAGWLFDLLGMSGRRAAA